MRGIGAGAGNRKIDAAEPQLLDGFGPLASWPAGKICTL